MSGIARRIYETLLAAEAPMTVPAFRSALPDIDRNVLAAMLSLGARRGRLVRSGKFRQYAYALSDWKRAELVEHGLDAVRIHSADPKPIAADKAPRENIVYAALLDAPQGLTYRQARLACPDLTPGFVAYVLSEGTKRGHLRVEGAKPGTSRVYLLTDELRTSCNIIGVHAALADAKMAWRNQMLRVRGGSVPEQRATPQPVWPADDTPAPMQRFRPLSISLGLPWHDEEEPPPCVVERYRDALRPLPLDD